MDEIGGDFLEAFFLDEHTLIATLADATGHGISASLFTMVYKTLLHGSFARQREPARVLELVNKGFLESAAIDGYYIDACLVSYDTVSRRGRYAAAGHPHGLIFRKEGAGYRLREHLGVKSLMLGMNEAARFGEVEFRLDDDELLLLTSDGMVESPCARRDPVRYPGNCAILRSLPGQRPLADLLGEVRSRGAFAPAGRRRECRPRGTGSRSARSPPAGRRSTMVHRPFVYSRGIMLHSPILKGMKRLIPVILLLAASALAAEPEMDGIASWYGGKFHGRLTSSGEVFDTNEMTAAHRTLPFGTIVKVTNLDNGKTAMVKINDRGPFVEGRIIDLSRAAAEQIDMLGHGRGPRSSLDIVAFASRQGHVRHPGRRLRDWRRTPKRPGSLLESAGFVVTVEVTGLEHRAGARAGDPRPVASRHPEEARGAGLLPVPREEGAHGGAARLGEKRRPAAPRLGGTFAP